MADPLQLETIEQNIIQCELCPRLVEWRQRIGRVKRRAFANETYWAKPVPGFGDPLARVLIVGLAPGAHGSNRTGRMFTGDDSGRFLFSALYRVGFANQPGAVSLSDGLELRDVFITALCRCVPPDNKPTPAEISNCSVYIDQELNALDQIVGLVALGKLAFDAVQKMIYTGDTDGERSVFGHGVFRDASDGKPWLIGSYHPSRQNTQTGRLTAAMFDAIWQRVIELLNQ